jgi:hypothetical protein
MPDVFVSEPQKDVSSPVPASISPAESQIESQSHLGSFRSCPEDIDFETKEKDEKIILFLRAHPVTNFKWILVTVFMIFVPIVAKTFGIFASLPAGFELIINLTWYLVTATYALECFLGWYSNVYFVTNLRVIDVDFYSLIYKQVSDANVDKIQDVTYNTGGVARAFFNYGNVFIQTAAEVSEFDFLSVPNPAKVAKIIEDLITKDKQK